MVPRHAQPAYEWKRNVNMSIPSLLLINETLNIMSEQMDYRKGERGVDGGGQSE